jgi:hypothetical protein
MHLHTSNAIAGEFFFNTSLYISLVYNAHVIIVRITYFSSNNESLLLESAFFCLFFSSFCRQAVPLGGTVGER